MKELGPPMSGKLGKQLLNETQWFASLFCWTYHGFAQDKLMLEPSSCVGFSIGKTMVPTNIFCPKPNGSAQCDVERARFEFLYENRGSVQLFLVERPWFAQDELMYQPSSC